MYKLESSYYQILYKRDDDMFSQSSSLAVGKHKTDELLLLLTQTQHSNVARKKIITYDDHSPPGSCPLQSYTRGRAAYVRPVWSVGFAPSLRECCCPSVPHCKSIHLLRIDWCVTVWRHEEENIHQLLLRLVMALIRSLHRFLELLPRIFIFKWNLKDAANMNH